MRLEARTCAEFYGRNRNDRNAYCKAERAADRAAFTAKYGGKAASAFGKCVSSKNKKQ